MAATGTARAVRLKLGVLVGQVADVAVEPVVIGAIAVVVDAIVGIVAGAVVPAVVTVLAAGPGFECDSPATG